MRGPVLRIFKLILRVTPKLTSDAFYESPRVAEIFAKESLESVPRYSNVRPFLECVPALILSPASTNAILKERGRERGMIVSSGSSRIEMIFALLAELVAIQMRFPKYKSGNRVLRGCFFGSTSAGSTGAWTWA